METNGRSPIRPVQSRDFDEEKAKTLPHHRFKLYDADGELYYEGWSSDCTTEDAFDPLECYGKPNAGAISIFYLNELTGRWEAL